MNLLFPDDIVASFTEGDCWVLAQAIHQTTGWMIVAVGACEEDPVEEITVGPDWVHMAVRTPQGHLLDIMGLHKDEEKFLDRWWDDAAARYCQPEVYLFDVNTPEQFHDLTQGQGHFPLYNNYSREHLAGVVDCLVECASGKN